MRAGAPWPAIPCLFCCDGSGVPQDQQLAPDVAQQVLGNTSYELVINLGSIAASGKSHGISKTSPWLLMDIGIYFFDPGRLVLASTLVMAQIEICSQGGQSPGSNFSSPPLPFRQGGDQYFSSCPG